MKQGRPRSYRFVAKPGFADQRIGLADSALDESAERLIDLIESLDSRGLQQVPDGVAASAQVSIARLVKHLVWGELNWVRRVTGAATPAELAERCRDGALELFVRPPLGNESADDLVDLVRDCRRHSSSVLRTVTDADSIFDAEAGPKSPAEVLNHLLWHWTYHTGQIGLLRDFAGGEYTWRFESNVPPSG